MKTARAENFFYGHDTHHNQGLETSTNPNDKRKIIQNMESTISDEDDPEECEDPSTEEEDDEEEPIMCLEDAEDAHLYLHLPIRNKCGSFRTVDGKCAICYCEYEVGDKVVWSGLECRHAFHDECILPWLAKGKKRCPICRHWFVPGARIDDQKKALEERLRLESSGDITNDTAGNSNNICDEELGNATDGAAISN